MSSVDTHKQHLTNILHNSTVLLDQDLLVGCVDVVGCVDMLVVFASVEDLA